MKLHKETCPYCNNPTYVPTPEGLRRLRELLKLSLRVVASELGVSVPYLSDVERGRRRITPNIVEGYKTLERRCAAKDS